jgi:hypothetical protein
VSVAFTAPANDGGSAITGYAEEQLRGRPLREIAAADAWDEAEPRFAVEHHHRHSSRSQQLQL